MFKSKKNKKVLKNKIIYKILKLKTKIMNNKSN